LTNLLSIRTLASKKKAMKKRIGIIGDGNVGGALARGLKRAGNELKSTGKNPKAVRETVDWAGMNLALGFDTSSGAEKLQKKLPRSLVVKAFNTVFAQQMETGRLGGQPLASFVSGDDAEAK
jgi:predicted dinucleotide-binding enzyme